MKHIPNVKQRYLEENHGQCDEKCESNRWLRDFVAELLVTTIAMGIFVANRYSAWTRQHVVADTGIVDAEYVDVRAGFRYLMTS
uniref:GOLD domain-containing protein n=1 Tax=Angiostrongylus cantonensis TaxID=6313 RepID=A0A0K0D2Z7_ANGCA